MAQDFSDVLERLHRVQGSHSLSILKLSEPISAGLDNNGTYSSDVSADSLENPTPASLEADLAHYKELFSKLRFSYLEQVTKEKFLRAIVGDPPLIVEHQDNVELEAQLAEVKTSLKQQKEEVAKMAVELDRKGRELASRHELITLQMTQIEQLPESIINLQKSIASLQEANSTQSNPALSLPLPATKELLQKQEAELEHANRQIAMLQSTSSRKTRELDKLEAELKPLEVQRLGSSSAAREAQRRKDEGLGGIGDDLEARGRWWRAVESGLKGVLEV